MACDEVVSVPGGVGGGLVYDYTAAIVTFVAPATSNGVTFQHWQVSIPSSHVSASTTELRLRLPAGYLWNNAVIEAFHG